jgi:hypothetical protein
MSRRRRNQIIEATYIEQVPQPAPAKPRLRINFPLAAVALVLAGVGLGINGWFSWNRGASDVDRYVWLIFGITAETALLMIPSALETAWRERRFVICAVWIALWPPSSGRLSSTRWASFP